MTSLMVGRCDNCSLNADTSLYGYYLYVGNCNCGNQLPAYNYLTQNMDYPVECRCDVIINNRKSRYECTQVADISDCVDYITYCTTDTFNQSDQIGLEDFCNSVEANLAPGESYTKLGDPSYYLDDGNIIWNLQYQASRCGSARTNLFDSNGNIFPSDQEPNCLPYSENIFSNDFTSISNQMSSMCLSGKPLLYSNACTDETCSVDGSCCVSRSNCENTTLECSYFESLLPVGVSLCAEGDNNTPRCPNPCASIIDIPDRTSGDTWDQDICEFLCPSYPKQNFYFGSNPGGNNDNKDDDTQPVGTIGNRICSEEYFMLCKLAGCDPDPQCKSDWSSEIGIAFDSDPHPGLHPTVY